MKKLVLLISITVLLFLVTGCASDAPIDTGSATAEFVLTPYHTATFTPTITPTPVGLPTETPRPTITPTPRTYQIYENDTLGGIAYYYGITVEELLEANPDVNPNLLVIGTRLIIPAARDVTSTAAAPTPTPFAVTLHELNCLPSSSGGLHCFVLVENERKNPASNLTGEFQLIDAAGEIISTRAVTLPLDHLEAGAKLPFYTYFTPAQAKDHTVDFALLTATRADENNTTSITLPVEVTDTLISASGSSASISGTVTLQNNTGTYTRLTLVAVAYDNEGNVIGMRRVEQETELSAGSPYPFTVEVFSVSGWISSVEIYAEAGN